MAELLVDFQGAMLATDAEMKKNLYKVCRFLAREEIAYSSSSGSLSGINIVHASGGLVSSGENIFRIISYMIGYRYAMAA